MSFCWPSAVRGLGSDSWAHSFIIILPQSSEAVDESKRTGQAEKRQAEAKNCRDVWGCAEGIAVHFPFAAIRPAKHASRPINIRQTHTHIDTQAEHGRLGKLSASYSC